MLNIMFEFRIALQNRSALESCMFHIYIYILYVMFICGKRSVHGWVVHDWPYNIGTLLSFDLMTDGRAVG